MLPDFIRPLSAVLLSTLALLASADVLAPALAWRAPLDLATGGGTRGEWRQNDSVYDYVDDATVAYLADGSLALAWVDQRRKDILFQTRGSDGQVRTGTVNVSRSGASFSWHPRIAASPQAGQAIYLLWQEIIFSGGSHGGDILFARSLDGGRSFEPPLNLSSSRGGDGKGRIDRRTWSNGSLDLAVAADGTVYAAWTEYEGALWFARSHNGGASFTKPRQVAGDTREPARAPALAVSRDGTVFLAWTVGENRDADIRIVRSGDRGDAFAPVATVGAPNSFADAPRLALDDAGRLHLVYSESAGGAPALAQVMYAREDQGGVGTPRPVSRAAAGAAYPAVAVARDGIVLVTWESYPELGGRPAGLGFAVSRDGGATFGAPSLVPGSRDPRGGNGSFQGLLGKKLAMSAKGEFAIVNSVLAPGQGSRVWLIRGALPPREKLSP
jgi:hypothetical protein